MTGHLQTQAVSFPLGWDTDHRVSCMLTSMQQKDAWEVRLARVCSYSPLCGLDQRNVLLIYREDGLPCLSHMIGERTHVHSRGSWSLYPHSK